MTPEVAKALADGGPWAVVVFIGGVLGIVGLKVVQLLWKDHLRSDLDDREERNRALDLLDTALTGNRDAAAANKAMAAAWDERNRIDEARNRADAARRRKADS